MSVEAPPKVLVEKYLIEIAKALNIDYEPDESVFEEERLRKEQAKRKQEAILIDFNEQQQKHFDPMLPPNQLPSTSQHPPCLPSSAPNSGIPSGIVRPIGFDLSSNRALIEKEFESLNPQQQTTDDQQIKQCQSPPPNYFDTISSPLNKPTTNNSKFNENKSSNEKSADNSLPSVPSALPNSNLNATNDEDLDDLEDLAKRFEALKK